MHECQPPVVTLMVGCTGCGKGTLSLEMASRTGGEIVSIDSMKVYRGMDIGTAKPSAEDRRLVPHHLLDVVEPWEDFTVAQYVELADRAIGDIQSRGRPVFVVGGTPLYVKALTEGLFGGPGADPLLRVRLREMAEREGSAALYRQLQGIDPKAAERIHPNDVRRLIRALEVFELTGRPISQWQQQWDQQRLRYQCLFIGLRRAREDQNARINERVRRMMDAGLVDEVRSLQSEPRPMSHGAKQALGYAEILVHLENRGSLAEAIEMIKINTRRFAKAQRTWFKRFRDVEWIDLTPESRVTDVADELVRRHGSLWSHSPR